MMQPNSLRKWIIFCWFDPWFKLVLRGMKRTLILLLSRRGSSTTKRWSYFLLWLLEWLLSQTIWSFEKFILVSMTLSILCIFSIWINANSKTIWYHLVSKSKIYYITNVGKWFERICTSEFKTLMFIQID